MRIAHSVRLGAWTLIGLNLLMALGSIWIFLRMAPAIEEIIERNELSLEACEAMLASLAMLGEDEKMNGELEKAFVGAFQRARNNITEEQEPAALASIKAAYPDAFLGNREAERKTVKAITLLGKINREAMIAADRRARQLGNAGAWGVVFMAIAVFFAGMLLKRNIMRNLVAPLEEINHALAASQTGDPLRRCTGAHLHGELKHLFGGINDLLDNSRFQSGSTNVEIQ